MSMQITQFFTASNVTDEWKSLLNQANIPLTVCVEDSIPA